MAPKRAASRRSEHPPSDAEEEVMDPKLEPGGEDGGKGDEQEAPPAKRSKKEAGGGKVGVKKEEGMKRATQVNIASDAEHRYHRTGVHEGIKWATNDLNQTKDKHSLPEEVTPRETLTRALKEQGSRPKDHAKGNVVHWMGMRDLRIEDSRALEAASQRAKQNGKHLIVLFVLSPGDYAAHDRSSRRIDFVLRTLRILQKELAELSIPLAIESIDDRKSVSQRVLQKCKEWQASDLFANIEHEVDELWQKSSAVSGAHEYGVHAECLEDVYVVPPGSVKTNDGRPYGVFSPWNKKWTEHLRQNPDLLEPSEKPSKNDPTARKDEKLRKLFDAKVPSSVKGFECVDREYMEKLWPAGTESARRVLQLFLNSKGGEVNPEPAAAEAKGKQVGSQDKASKIAQYGSARNLMSEHGTSRLSPYLSAGLISARECLRALKETTGGKLQVGRDSGPAMWATEISFRDFYGHVLSAWPRVCMSRAYLRKYENVKWEYNDEHFQAWKEGKTGYPIVDAAVRQGAKQGYMHNRGRMIVAMFLTKHLMLDWRMGEQWFMRSFIDGDLASNGWQWSASLGTDPQPYFRIFAPTSQSEKSDPDGEYIRHWVPELRNVKGKAIHEPFTRLGKEEFKKLGYPEPIVEHKWARERALRRFKDPGTE
ncbi:Deoxyribodipyrimidine photolyase/cryptochrome [Ceraceosorus bombacis]|uniref:Deoxyribodipyrimidine photolyase/cryptochrome n=1 Tax=Ceraceosorus bombacis TaxID=401625 RepID=A0A0N7LB24_9BASI|nr:Deoxyribodipyrimidine photolyase/cryptochrome [Ceraceosorus bombacis]